MATGATPVTHTLDRLKQTIRDWRAAGQTVALVPTMGALHNGHLELVRLGRKHCDRTVASIFVNPTQFAPNEDFGRYPRTLDTDRKLLASVNCDLVWAPDVATMYPEGFATRIVPAGCADGLETDFRPHFFGGVATICAKLFGQVGPDIAIFGEKDFQQLAVVRQMVRDLDLPLRIVGAPTVREADGLAMSSRNRYLTPPERAIAPLIYRAILEVSAKIAASADAETACADAAGTLTAGGFGKIDYVAVRDAQTLGPFDRSSGRPGRVLAAAWLNTTRLIDNVPVAA